MRRSVHGSLRKLGYKNVPSGEGSRGMFWKIGDITWIEQKPHAHEKRGGYGVTAIKYTSNCASIKFQFNFKLKLISIVNLNFNLEFGTFSHQIQTKFQITVQMKYELKFKFRFKFRFNAMPSNAAGNQNASAGTASIEINLHHLVFSSLVVRTSSIDPGV